VRHADGSDSQAGNGPRRLDSPGGAHLVFSRGQPSRQGGCGAAASPGKLAAAINQIVHGNTGTYTG
jgi:hypothetical protein